MNDHTPASTPAEPLSCWTLFFVLLRINAVTFGGGYTIVPIIRQEFVEKRKILTDDDMLDIIAIAESGPGAMAVSTSYLLGIRLRGLLGGISAVLGAVLPALFLITLLYFIYAHVANNPYIRAALRAMSGVIVAMLFFSVYTLYRPAVKEHKKLSIAFMLIAFLLSYFHILPVAYIIVLMIIAGVVIYGFLLKEEEVA